MSYFYEKVGYYGWMKSYVLDWKYIKKIESNNRGDLWFKADEKFGLPRGFIALRIRSRLARESAKNNALYDFFPFILTRVMAEVAYDAETANLDYEFSASEHGLNIMVKGINDKLTMLLDEVLDQITSFNPSQTEFDSLKVNFHASGLRNRTE